MSQDTHKATTSTKAPQIPELSCPIQSHYVS